MTEFTKIEPSTTVSPDLLNRRCVHIVDLCAVRTSIGPLWDSLRDGVHARMASILSLQLNSTDYYEKLDDTRYMVVIPAAQPEDGALAAMRVICDLLRSLNGTCDLSNVRIDRAEATSSGAIRGVPLQLAELSSLVEKAGVPDVVIPPHLRRGLKQNFTIGSKGTSRDPLRVEHGFGPVWDARHQVITTYLCQPEKIYCSKASNIGLGLDELSLKERSDIELKGLMTGVGHLTKSVEAGDRFLLGIPLSFNTMCSPYGRADFIRVCRGLPETYRQYLIFLLTNVPRGVTHSRLGDLVMALQPFGRVAADVVSGCHSFNAYEGHGLSAIAFDLKRAAASPDRVRTDIVNVSAASRNMQGGAMILNVADHQMLNIVNAADCRQIHGRIISPVLAAPRRMTHLPGTSFAQATGESGTEEWF